MSSKTTKDIAQEQRTMGLAELQGIRDLYQVEINNRGWAFIRAIGHKPFIETDVHVRVFFRGEVLMVSIAATFEERHETRTVNTEVPAVIFDQLTMPMVKAQTIGDVNPIPEPRPERP